MPEAARHCRIHAGHGIYIHPDEGEFVTPDLIEAACLVGTADQLVDKVAELEDAGLDHVMLLPSFDSRYCAVDEVGALLKRLG